MAGGFASYLTKYQHSGRLSDALVVGAGRGAVDGRHWTGLLRSPDVEFPRLTGRAMVPVKEALCVEKPLGSPCLLFTPLLLRGHLVIISI